MLRSPQAVECRLMPRSITGVVSALPPTLPPNYPGVGGNAWHDPGRASQKVLTNQYSPALLGTAWDPCHALQNQNADAAVARVKSAAGSASAAQAMFALGMMPHSRSFVP
jgi:hypothetical protein